MTTERRRRGPSRITQMLLRMNTRQLTRDDLSDTEQALLTGFMQEQTGRQDVFVPPGWRKTDDRPKRRRRT